MDRYFYAKVLFFIEKGSFFCFFSKIESQIAQTETAHHHLLGQ
jgi:hypothetical protein